MASVLKPDLLDAYAPPTTAYDELLCAAGLRPHWQSTFDYLRQSDYRPHVQRPRSGWTAEHTRPWQHDPLPLIMADDEWLDLSAGLTQRAKLLNAVVADLYGSQRLFAERTLPPGLFFGNPEFMLAAQGSHPPGGVYLPLIAFDLGRSPDGQWRVLSNRTEAPIGLGFCLENRILTARSMADLFNRVVGVNRLAGFLANYRQALRSQGRSARATEDNLTVILSEGPDGPGYFDHAYLGQYFGYPVVEGADLTVRDGSVFLKTLEGLKPIGVIQRQIDSARCDPLECDPDSLSGTPGLLAAARSGRVMVANAIGSGVIENDAIMSFLPALCERLLDESLKLPSLATWWCGQAEEAEHVIDNLETLVLRSAYERKPLVTSTVAQYLESDSPANPDLVDAIRTQPYAFVGRESIELSSVPYLSADSSLKAAPMTLRVFAAATEEGYALMPGGLARISTPAGDLSKDVWVTAERARVGSFPPATATASNLPTTSTLARRSDRDLPSRTADDLFWLGRYLERAEGATHVYRSLFQFLTEGGSTEERVNLSILTGLLGSLGYLAPSRSRKVATGGRPTVERELFHILFDPDGANALHKLINHIFRTADHVRERLSSDAWRTFQRLADLPAKRPLRSLVDAVNLLDDILQCLSALNGQISENMIQSYGWRLLDLGRRIERGLFGVRVMRDLALRQDVDESTRLDLLLETNDSRITYRSRYQSTPSVTTVLDLLMVDTTNPRSVIYQIERMREHLVWMPMEDTSRGLSASQHAALTLYNDLTLADVDQLAGAVNRQGIRQDLRRLLTRLETTTVKVSELIANTYFEHLPNRSR
ncbi:MAG: circularly permuted type 2 ATP-grasp protein [Proteobacteria bacterium]|nr:circularly permuted type 2 ATP-grasp protein [Pseudomonadota bacterium]